MKIIMNSTKLSKNDKKTIMQYQNICTESHGKGCSAESGESNGHKQD